MRPLTCHPFPGLGCDQGNVFSRRIPQSWSGYWRFCQKMEETGRQWSSREGKVAPRMEKQTTGSANVHFKDSETRSNDICFGVRVFFAIICNPI